MSNFVKLNHVSQTKTAVEPILIRGYESLFRYKDFKEGLTSLSWLIDTLAPSRGIAGKKFLYMLQLCEVALLITAKATVVAPKNEDDELVESESTPYMADGYKHILKVGD